MFGLFTLLQKKFNLLARALQKLQPIIPIRESIFLIASIHETIGNTKQILKWYQVLLIKMPTDAGLLPLIGNIFLRAANPRTIQIRKVKLEEDD